MSTSIIIIAMILIAAVNYCCLILFFTYGLCRLKKGKHEQYNYFPDITSPATGVHEPLSREDSPLSKQISVIIAARNEENNIGNCLQCLVQQDYPQHLYEVIVVNDQSEDKSGEIIDLFIQSGKLNLQQFSTTGTGGKKAALKIGLEHSQGEVILFTDADCLPAEGWITAMVNCFKSTNALMVAGPVVLIDNGSFFSRFQVSEFNSLLASTAGSIGAGKPIMCNGANLGFVKETYKQLQSGGLSGSKINNVPGEDFSSGDDIFMMLTLKKLFGAARIKFLNNRAGIVYSKPFTNLIDFKNQRIRWTSKSSGYKDFFVVYTALTVFVLNLILLILGVSLLAGLRVPITTNNIEVVNTLPYLAIALFSCKCFVDFILLYSYTGMFGQRKQLLLLIIFEPLVIFYTSLIGIAGNVMTFSWKGRIHRK